MKQHKFELTSFHLHILAMALMLCDHMWHTVIPGNDWMTAIGRIAFPIFAFMTVEGFYKTKSLKKYAKRLLFFALISEIPFNLMLSGSIVYPYHQNVIWTFLIGMGLMWINEKAKEKALWLRIAVIIGSIVFSYIIGALTMVDYYYGGLFMILVFYFFRKKKWYNFIAQLVLMIYINSEVLGGYYFTVEIFGTEIEVVRQSLAVFALIPIWLYNGKQGYHNKAIKALYYWFYPAHLLILWAAREIIWFLA